MDYGWLLPAALIALFVLVVAGTELTRRPRPPTPGENEAKARSTGQDHMGPSAS